MGMTSTGNGNLPSAVASAATRPAADSGSVLEAIGEKELDQWLEDIERRAILDALAQCNSVQAHAAKRLGITERSLWHRIKKLGIQINRVVN